MYYPYFRGKQYELITIRETAELMAKSRFVPIIEPVRAEMTGLRKTLDEIRRAKGSAIGSELTTPVLPSAAPIDYIPSQYLCEFIKKCKYDGVLYSSSVSNGVNFALFDPDKASVGRVKRYTINSVDVDFREVP